MATDQEKEMCWRPTDERYILQWMQMRKKKKIMIKALTIQNVFRGVQNMIHILRLWRKNWNH